MMKFLPFILMILYGVAVYQFSVWRTRTELTQRSKPLRDARLQALCDRMARALDLPQVEVHVYDIEPVNGLAAPDGRIFLTQGFLDRYRAGVVSAEELASVIAHELGHVALGHTRRRMIDFSGQNAVRMALAVFLNRFLPGLGALIASALVTLLAARMSRDDEYAADEWAAALLVRSGIGTAPQKALFQKLERLTGARGGPPVWLASHPPTPARIAAIEALEHRWGTALPPKTRL